MKPWYTSKMLWVNTLAAMLVALEAKWDFLQPYLPINFYTGMAVALPVINAMLRIITSQALTFGARNAQ